MSQQGPYDPTQQGYGYGDSPYPGQPGAQPPYPGYGAPQQQGYGQAYPEQSQATTILVLGILSLVACGLLGPFAWKMGNAELAAIDAGRRPPNDRQNANIGRILGIVGTVFVGIGLAFVVLYAVVAVLFISGAAVSSSGAAIVGS